MIYIKNMVCHRCVIAVQNIFTALEIPVKSVRLGEVETVREVPSKKMNQLSMRFQDIGFELIDDRKSRTIERIKTAVIEFTRSPNDRGSVKLSHYLADKLYRDYGYLSKLFSEVEGTTIEKYHIAQRVERVKELVVYDELTIQQIAFEMAYSSPSYLSSQFKKATGLTPSHFKRIASSRRKSLDQVTGRQKSSRARIGAQGL